MDDLMIAATSLIAQETRRVEAAAHNIANTATPGFKREVAFQDILESQHSSLGENPSIASIRTGVATDFANGKLVHTGNPLDITINGEGFFEVSTPEGMAYTRAGSFQRDEQGRLLTSQGWPLQAKGGGDVLVTSKSWHIESDGTVIDNGVPAMAIRVTQFADQARLSRQSDGLFLARGMDPTESETTKITQGFLEASNVSVGNDMVQIMEAMRRAESGQKLVHAYDDMIGNVLQRLGDM